jgi:diguanylate cyclase (GGDEF)-like protein
LKNWLFFMACVLVAGITSSAQAALNVEKLGDQALGKSIHYFHESAGRLTLAQAQSQPRERFYRSVESVLSFGIGAKPVWLHIAVDNPSAEAAGYQLLIDTTWLDELDIYAVSSAALQEFHSGDLLPVSSRVKDERPYVFPLEFAPGRTELWLRIATPDPMVIPLFLLDQHALDQRISWEQYSYGFGYGFLLALIAYNLMLFLGLRDSRYFLYSLYLSVFIATNLAYTGHAFYWFWPSQIEWQQWAQPSLMVAFALSGLLFATRFLELNKHFPRRSRLLAIFSIAVVALLLLSYRYDQQARALLLAFSAVAIYTALMFAIGVSAYLKGLAGSKYFLLAVTAGIVGTVLTLLAVWGGISYNNWSFRAVELGMLLESSLLALALAERFRLVEQDRVRVQKMAELDELTGLNNRRAFKQQATSAWYIAQRYRRPLSVILFDLDNFKQVNDQFGHHAGDEVLTAVGRLLNGSIRQGDVAARWGGEEFLLLLSETTLEEAEAFADRLRQGVGRIKVSCDKGCAQVTASFGVTACGDRDGDVEQLIQRADQVMYDAKGKGRNQVLVAYPETGKISAVL